MAKQFYNRQTMVGYIPGGQRGKTTYGGRSKWLILILRTIITFFLAGIVVGGSWFRVTILKELPDISEIESFNFKQATTITDRNGEVLYRMFEENRQYIPYEAISENFINGIVATEDQRFRDNPGIDPIGIVRAAITDITQGKTHGASTITQQLIKIIMLSPEKKIERKLKEIVLATKINSYIKDSISMTSKGLSDDIVDKKVKEKIMELYANLVFFGNNSYGVEAASQTYFSKKTSELSILEASVLAGMPQAPSRYDPFSNRKAIMGEMVVTDKEGTPVETSDEIIQTILAKVENSLDDSRLSALQKNDQAVLEFVTHVLDISIPGIDGTTYEVSYALGRKDIVLVRMFEEGYITEHEFKKAFIEGLTFEFQRSTTTIKAPHFVFRVINQLEEQYNKDTLQKGGLTIKTTLDYNIQQLAEESIKENESKLTSNLANNTALLYVDSLNGDVLAYVGSKDYNNEGIDGQVDIVQSPRQPGSTMKPLIYAKGFMDLPLTLDSPIYDIAMKIGKDEPNNADGLFRGLTTIRQALAGSRNIPAIKMFFGVGGESVIKPFLQQLGIQGLKEEKDFYGYPLSIGAAEVTMMDLTNAYMHLSAMGSPAEINPIMEIRGPNNNLLYKKEVDRQSEVIPLGVAYILRTILSDNSNMPANWASLFTAPGKIKFATKTGTTNIVKGKEKLPRDGWLMSYTPSKVLAIWAGNTDGSAMNKNAYGGFISSPTRKSFIEKLVDQGYLENETPPRTEVKEVVIAKTSGKLVSNTTPLFLSQRTLAYLKTAPTEIDTNAEEIDIDKMCNGLPSELTPPKDIAKAWFIKPESILPDKRDVEDIKERRTTTGIEKMSQERDVSIVVEQLTGSCEARETQFASGDMNIDLMKPKNEQTIGQNFSVRYQASASIPVSTIKILLGETELKTITYKKDTSVSDIVNVAIPESIPDGPYTLKIIGIDHEGYVTTKTIAVTVKRQEDTTPPYLMEEKVQIQATNDPNSYKVIMLFADDDGIITQGSIEQSGEIIKSFTENATFIETDDLENPLTRVVMDNANNTGSGTIERSSYRVIPLADDQ